MQLWDTLGNFTFTFIYIHNIHILSSYSWYLSTSYTPCIAVWTMVCVCVCAGWKTSFLTCGTTAKRLRSPPLQKSWSKHDSLWFQIPSHWLRYCKVSHVCWPPLATDPLKDVPRHPTPGRSPRFVPADPALPRLRPGLYVGDYGHGMYGSLTSLGATLGPLGAT